MKNFLFVFFLLTIFPLSLKAYDKEHFDQLPIHKSEVNKVTSVFWSAQSIQDQVKSQLPTHVRSNFTRKQGTQGCDILAVFKTEGSADTCELNDDPERMAKFIYNFSVSCDFGKYQVSICSHGENKLLNQIKVINPERLVSDDEILDWDSKI